MDYYIRFNQNESKSFKIKTFSESITENGGSLMANLDVDTISSSKQINIDLEPFFAEGSINKIEIINGNDMVLYGTAEYSKIDSINVNLNISMDNNIGNDNIVYSLSCNK